MGTNNLTTFNKLKVATADALAHETRPGEHVSVHVAHIAGQHVKTHAAVIHIADEHGHDRVRADLAGDSRHLSLSISSGYHSIAGLNMEGATTSMTLNPNTHKLNVSYTELGGPGVDENSIAVTERVASATKAAFDSSPHHGTKKSTSSTPKPF